MRVTDTKFNPEDLRSYDPIAYNAAQPITLRIQVCLGTLPLGYYFVYVHDV